MASWVRLAAFRRPCLSFEKSISIGLRSGEYLGRQGRGYVRSTFGYRRRNGRPYVRSRSLLHASAQLQDASAFPATRFFGHRQFVQGSWLAHEVLRPLACGPKEAAITGCNDAIEEISFIDDIRVTGKSRQIVRG